MRYSKEEKLSLVNFYYNGKSVTEICMEHQIPRSTKSKSKSLRF